MLGLIRLRHGRAGLLLLASVLLLFAATGFGSVPIPMHDLVSVLLGRGPEERKWVADVWLQLRVPRVLVAWLVGAALAQAGAVLQTLFRNPLAEPGVLGVSATASLFAVTAIYCGLGAWHASLVPLFAFGGGLVATLLLFGQSRRYRGSHETILLMGVGIGQVAVALTSWLISVSLGNWEIAHKLMSWLLGSLEGRGYGHVVWALGPVAGTLVWGRLRARELDALLLGDATATSLGVDVQRLRREVIFVSSLLTGVSVAISGVVAFIGLIVPHLVRRWMGPKHGQLLAVSMFVGGAFLVLSDLIARRVIAPEEMRLGVVTALLGAPLFIVTLARQLRERSS